MFFTYKTKSSKIKNEITIGKNNLSTEFVTINRYGISQNNYEIELIFSSKGIKIQEDGTCLGTGAVFKFYFLPIKNRLLSGTYKLVDGVSLAPLLESEPYYEIYENDTQVDFPYSKTFGSLDLSFKNGIYTIISIGSSDDKDVFMGLTYKGKLKELTF